DTLLARWPADAATPPVIEALRGELYRRKGSPEQALVHFARAAADLVAPAGAHRCRACGQAATTWVARCGRCGLWDTIVAGASADLMSSPSGSTGGDHCVGEASG
ncbi:MAG: hypothetical protein ACREQL_08630, partial [Candidatus Binatia bacterium]